MELDKNIMGKIVDIKEIDCDKYYDLMCIYMKYYKYINYSYTADKKKKYSYDYATLKSLILDIQDRIDQKILHGDSSTDYNYKLEDGKKISFEKFNPTRQSIKLRKKALVINQMLDDCLFNFNLDGKDNVQYIVDLITYSECVLNFPVTYKDNLEHLLLKKLKEFYPEKEVDSYTKNLGGCDNGRKRIR